MGAVFAVNDRGPDRLVTLDGYELHGLVSRGDRSRRQSADRMALMIVSFVVDRAVRAAINVAKTSPIPEGPAAVAAAAVAAAVLCAVLMIWSWAHYASVPSISVEPPPEDEMRGPSDGSKSYSGNGISERDGAIICYDPATMRVIKEKAITSPEEVEKRVRAASAAQKVWARSDFAQRRRLMRILQKHTLEHQRDICRVSAIDSGKPMLDAAFGEVLTTLEKIRWLIAEGEQALRPERRSAGALVFYKSARVEFHPLGVVGAIVPWNYPFHNILNPVTAALFAGCACVVKVSEYASWSAEYYERILVSPMPSQTWPRTRTRTRTSIRTHAHTRTTHTRTAAHAFVRACMRGWDEALSPHSPPSKSPWPDLTDVTDLSARGAGRSGGAPCACVRRVRLRADGTGPCALPRRLEDHLRRLHRHRSQGARGCR